MKKALRTLAAITVAVVIATALASYWTAAAMILRAAGTSGWLGRAAQWDARTVSDHIERIPVRDGVIRLRIFRPSGAARHAVLLTTGVHADGIDEPRLLKLARDLAGTGVTVVTPEIPDLRQYLLTARVTNTIEDAALWMLSREDLFGGGPIAMIGVSFSGGLSIVAAGRPALRDRVSSVLSFGGHGNLPRVLRYLCTGIEPALSGGRGPARTPHDYALAVVLYQAADLIVPVEQAGALRHGIEAFLRASVMARTRPEQANALFEEARAAEQTLAEPAAALMTLVNTREVVALGARLEPLLDRLGQDPALSPDRSAPPAAPVYLLHGAGDSVIPSVETELLARHLGQATSVRYLLSGFLTHVDLASRPTLGDSWRMISFWKAALDL